ncbi:MAG: hypothetical protein R2682_12945 [Pyrinomonadaceae bacterium]
MTHFNYFTTIFILLLLLAATSAGQSPVEFRAASAEEQAPRLIQHVVKIVDWNVTFSIRNISKSDVIVYGWDQGNGKFDPVLYLLRFNEKTNSWEYPNSSNAPTPWEKESGIMKSEKRLKPGESLTFSRAFSRVSDCGRRVIVTAQIGAPKSKKTHEIRSEEYVVPCSDKKPSPEDVARIIDAWLASARRNALPKSTSEYCSQLTVSMLAEKNTLQLSPRDDGKVTIVVRNSSDRKLKISEPAFRFQRAKTDNAAVGRGDAFWGRGRATSIDAKLQLKAGESRSFKVRLADLMVMDATQMLGVLKPLRSQIAGGTFNVTAEVHIKDLPHACSSTPVSVEVAKRLP